MSRPRVALLSHTSGMDGPIDRLRDHLVMRGFEIANVVHPLDSYEGRATVVSLGDTMISSRPRRAFAALPQLNLVLDALITVRSVLRLKPDAIVAGTNLDSVAGLVARFLSRRRGIRVIYLGVDYAETRFANRLVDRLYRSAEAVCLRRCDVVVSNTRRAEEARRALGLDVTRSVIVPNGALVPDAPQPRSIQRRRFVYVGTVNREHGLLELVEALHGGIDHLTLIGHGDDWDYLVARCQELGIALEAHNNKSHEFVLTFLTSFDGIGLAPYNNHSRWTWYCSPMKVVEYLACGVPVVMSAVPELAAEVSERGLGIVFDDIDGAGILSALDALDLEQFAEASRAFYQDYRADLLFDRIQVVG
jgi:glycosyltransferase involved in cell wall biosynthesis